MLVRTALAVIAAAVVLFVRPLTAGSILWTLALALLALVAMELVRRPAGERDDPPLQHDRTDTDA